MNKISKKIASVGLTLTTTIWLSGAVMLVPVAHAQSSIADLEAQIQALLATITQLQASLVVLQGGAPSASVSCSFTRDLTMGSSGADVKCLQQYLNSDADTKVADSGVGSPGNETEFFGSLTKAAAIKWQDKFSAQVLAPVNLSAGTGYWGNSSRSYYSSLAAAAPSTPGVPSVPGVIVPASGISVSLASDTPVAATIPKKASNVPYFKFNLAGKGKVSTIVVRRVGAGATGDFDNVYLYDGGTRLVSGRSVNSSTHRVTFTGLNLDIDGVKQLLVTADVATSPGSANRNAFQIDAVDSITSDVEISGSFPIMGNEFVNSAAQAGTLTATKTGSIADPNIGQKEALVSQFRLTAATEDAFLTRISLFYAGNLSKSNLSNMVLKDFVTGDVLSSVDSLTSKDLAVFELADGFTIKKGENKTFQVFADIGGASKKDDTIKFYIEENSDIFGSGSQYGYGLGVTKTSFDSDAADHHVLTLLGGQFTITFNGPVSGDVAKEGKDVVLYDFSITSVNNIEIRKVNASVSFTATGDDGPLEDFKLVDVESGLIVAGPSDISTAAGDSGAGVQFSDVFTMTAGETRRFKFTADIPSNWDDADTVKVDLAKWGSADLKNLDNNTFLASTEIVPDAVISGNTQTIKAPTLEINLAGVPTSQSFVKGTKLVPFVGFSFRATADDIKITTIKLSATPASSTIAAVKSDLLSIAIYDGDTRISDFKSFTGASLPGVATFSNLEYVVPNGVTKVLVVKADFSNSATVLDEHAIGIANVADTTGVDVVAVDSDGKEPSYSGTDKPNYAGSNVVKVTVLNSGSISVTLAADDSESKAGIILAGASQVVLSKFRFEATDEAMTINKLKVLVNDSASTNATSTAITDEVSMIYLYEGSTLLASAAPVGGTGDLVGNVTFDSSAGLFSIGKNESKIITVKADINTISANADTGTEVRAHIMSSGFKATGAASTITLLGNAGAIGNEKVVYRTYPTLSIIAMSNNALPNATDLEVLKFRVSANSAHKISWGAIGFQLTLTNASIANTTIAIRDLTLNQDLTIGTQTPNTAGLDLINDLSYSVIVYLATEQQIAAGSSRDYLVKITGTQTEFGTANETETLTTKLVLHNDSSASNLANAATLNFASSSRVDATLDSLDNAFVWSDWSSTGHGVGTSDWANGVYLDTFPSESQLHSH